MLNNRPLLATFLTLGLVLAPLAVWAEEEGSHGAHHPHHEGSHGTHQHGEAGCCQGEKAIKEKEQKAEKNAAAPNGTTGQAPGLAGENEGEEEGSH